MHSHDRTLLANLGFGGTHGGSKTACPPAWQAATAASLILLK